MKAEVFYMADQESIVSGLRKALREHLYSGLELIEHKIAPSGGMDVIEAGRQYVKLLAAAINPETGLQLGLTYLENYGHSFYVHVYYPFFYFGKEGFRKEFQENQLLTLFPALALRNRMTLVPEGLGSTLDVDGRDRLSPFNPLEMGGVIEVNFNDPHKVAEAADRAAQAARADLIREMQAWGNYRSKDEIDLPTMASKLEVDAGFLDDLFKAHRGTFYRQFTCDLAPHKIPFGRWTKISLSITNHSEAPVSELQVKISGPVEIRPARIQLDVPAGLTQMVPVSLKPTDRGEFPLEVVLTLPAEQAFSQWLPVQHLWLECD